jgi:predicted ribonuclease toxin of YeeF-YezG toxin-antitoxin module
MAKDAHIKMHPVVASTRETINRAQRAMNGMHRVVTKKTALKNELRAKPMPSRAHRAKSSMTARSAATSRPVAIAHNAQNALALVNGVIVVHDATVKTDIRAMTAHPINNTIAANVPRKPSLRNAHNARKAASVAKVDHVRNVPHAQNVPRVPSALSDRILHHAVSAATALALANGKDVAARARNAPSTRIVRNVGSVIRTPATHAANTRLAPTSRVATNPV